MNSAKYPVTIAMLVIVLTHCGCPLLVPEIRAELSDLTLCQGWDAEGDLIVLPDVVPPDETRICVCGHLETNSDLYLQVFWDRERSELLTHRQVFSDGPFLSCIEREEGFEPGNYGVSIIGTKTVMGLLEFSVGEEQ